ncbi:MAG: TIGR02266 family protein [Deltaproteobacteria bacterium]|nr:TIGR02266 family protein [Deltaproteobacteria bacterium]
MAGEPIPLKAAGPAATAKDMLGEALGQIQDIKNDALNVEDVTASIAKAVGALFAVQASDPFEPAHTAGVCHAMDHLRGTLGLMQDVGGDDPALSNATQTIAKTLAILYPVSKVQERQSMAPERAPSIIGDKLPEDPRRSLQRVAIEADIGFQSDNNFFTGFSEDISAGGIFIATFDLRPIGSPMMISFTLPDGRLVSADGVVRWLREYNETTPNVEPGMGVQFTTLNKNDEEAINSFLEQREPLFYDA